MSVTKIAGLVTIVVLIGVVLIVLAKKDSSTKATTLTSRTPAEIHERLTNKNKSILIDVRTEQEYKEGHIAGSILIPHTDIAKKITSVAPSKKAAIILYCRSDRRSGLALQALQSIGYTNVVDLDGGIVAWQQSGYPLTTKP